GVSDPSTASVTRWVQTLRKGDSEIALQLWNYLQQRLTGLAKRHTDSHSSVAYDEEDVALSAFGALCDGIQAGRYDQLSDRDELWRLVSVIVVNKARNRFAHENRQRRGGNYQRVDDPDSYFQTLVSDDLTPEKDVVMREECGRLIELLEMRELKLVALLKIESHTNDEIAELLNCSRRSVQRRLVLIRDILSKELSVG
ncbi:MAG: ECF-type sigma factor, partial [Planctomycetota bacterium]